jgi:hypothetical protein
MTWNGPNKSQLKFTGQNTSVPYPLVASVEELVLPTFTVFIQIVTSSRMTLLLVFGNKFPIQTKFIQFGSVVQHSRCSIEVISKPRQSTVLEQEETFQLFSWILISSQ